MCSMCTRIWWYGQSQAYIPSRSPDARGRCSGSPHVCLLPHRDRPHRSCGCGGCARCAFDGAVGFQISPYEGRVAPLHRALKKLHAQRRHRFLGFTQDHHTRGIFIEAVHQSRPRNRRFVIANPARRYRAAIPAFAAAGGGRLREPTCPCSCRYPGGPLAQLVVEDQTCSSSNKISSSMASGTSSKVRTGLGNSMVTTSPDLTLKSASQTHR